MYLDKRDLDILRLVQDNPKIRLRDLSEKLGLPRSTVYYRLRELEKRGVIRGYRAVLDSETLGFEYPVVILVRGRYGPRYHEEIGMYLSNNPYIQMVYYVLGEEDFVVVGKFPSKEKYMYFLESLINSSFIERTTTMVVAKIIKEDLRLSI